jgi:hypothetical protein
MIPETIFAAKGDLLGASANDTPAILSVGANGETLVADSSTSTGLRYQSGYNGNSVINGGQDIWQRGTSIANTATYVYAQDRYRMGGATAQTTSRQAVNDTTNLPTIQYCARMQRNSGSTATDNIVLGYSAESADSYRFAGQTVTLSFYARAGANYSAASSAFRAVVSSGTGTDQNILSGFTGAATVINGTPTLTTTWQRFTFTGTVAATVTQIGHTLFYTPVGTAGANDYAEVTGVQLELGAVATTFKRSNGAGGTIQGELAACQRYYQRITATIANAYIGNGFARDTTQSYCTIPFAVTMRTSPTALEQNGTAADYALLYLDSSSALSAVPFFASGAPSMILIGANLASGLTAGDGLVFRIVTAGAYLGWSAEL